MRILLASVAILMIAGAGCAPKPYASSNKIYKEKSRDVASLITKRPGSETDSFGVAVNWVGSVNFNIRKPNFVVLHHTAQNTCGKTVETFTTEKTQVSSHYVICKDGTIYQMLNDYLRGWHAGAGRWGSVTDLNSVSLGIEMDNDGNEPYPEVQVGSLIRLLERLKKTYNIPDANFIGHGDIAPGRKVDPGTYFPWKLLADSGYGKWYDTTGIQLPANFDHLIALRIIGYDVKEPDRTIEAFRRHYLASNATGKLTDEELKVLYAVMRNYL